jgi:hypothetical protein
MFVRKSIKVPLYSGYFDIIVMDETNKFDNLYLDKFNREEVFGHSIQTRLIKTKITHFVMVLNFNSNYPITHGIISHESLHITSFILDHIGQDFYHNNHEDFSYLIQWITDQVYIFLEQKNFKVKIHGR